MKISFFRCPTCLIINQRNTLQLASSLKSESKKSTKSVCVCVGGGGGGVLQKIAWLAWFQNSGCQIHQHACFYVMSYTQHPPSGPRTYIIYMYVKYSVLIINNKPKCISHHAVYTMSCMNYFHGIDFSQAVLTSLLTL